MGWRKKYWVFEAPTVYTVYHQNGNINILIACFDDKRGKNEIGLNVNFFKGCRPPWFGKAKLFNRNVVNMFSLGFYCSYDIPCVKNALTGFHLPFVFTEASLSSR